MMYIKIVSFLLLTTQLFAMQLQRNYFIDGDEVYLSSIIKNIPKDEDTLLFELEDSKHLKRIKSDELLKLLNHKGYKDLQTAYPYIQFSKKSPIDTTKIEEELAHYYMKYYPNIQIKNIEVSPRKYMEQMPENYTVEMRSRDYLQNEGYVAIKTDDNKKIFFNYHINGSVDVYVLTQDLERNSELTTINTRKNSIILDQFRALPLQKVQNGVYQVRHQMAKGEILTQRDVEALFLVKRESYINVFLQNGTITISFSARALQNGIYGESIFVENDKGKKIKVIVTGKNKAKVK